MRAGRGGSKGQGAGRPGRDPGGNPRNRRRSDHARCADQQLSGRGRCRWKARRSRLRRHHHRRVRHHRDHRQLGGGGPARCWTGTAPAGPGRDRPPGRDERCRRAGGERLAARGGRPVEIGCLALAAGAGGRRPDPSLSDGVPGRLRLRREAVGHLGRGRPVAISGGNPALWVGPDRRADDLLGRWLHDPRCGHPAQSGTDRELARRKEAQPHRGARSDADPDGRPDAPALDRPAAPGPG